MALRAAGRAIRAGGLAGALAVAALLAACAPPLLPRPVDGATASTPAPRVAPDAATFRIEAVTGAPGNAGDRLRDHFADAAAARGLGLVLRRDLAVDYRVFVQLSAVGDVTGVTLASVVDVVDANGLLVHRVHGFEAAPGSAGDPWTGLSDDALRLVAVRSVEAIDAWLRRPGA